jgi:hypothetical protein
MVGACLHNNLTAKLAISNWNLRNVGTTLDVQQRQQLKLRIKAVATDIKATQ